MTFALHVDGERWRAHTSAVRDAVRTAVATSGGLDTAGDLVPVAKGNGYGVGNARLAAQARRLGVGALAVGTVRELLPVADAFPGDLVVLEPFEPADARAVAVWDALAADVLARTVRTVSSPQGLLAAAAAGSPDAPVRVLVEGLTSLGRFGLEPDAVEPALTTAAVAAALADGALVIEGLALHLPLTEPDPDHRAVPGARWHDSPVVPAWPAGSTTRVHEVVTWARGWQELLARLTGSAGERELDGLATSPTLWLSHVADAELAVIRTLLPDVALRVRIGTRLWHGDRTALAARGTVLAVHGVARGERSGYRQGRSSRDGALLVVAGGTAHGVALAAPRAVSGARQRVSSLGVGVLEAGGRALSPFTVAGRQRWFAEPPHMQVSLLRLPAGLPVPAVGDEVDCEVRLTTATFDEVLGLD